MKGTDGAIGVAGGIISGIYVKAKTFGFILSQITWEATLDTAYYAAVGALVGGFVSFLWSLLKKRLKRYVEKED